MLGKRKRETQVVSRRRNEDDPSQSKTPSTIESTELFRRHFEATFAPLPEQRVDQDEDDDSLGEDSSDAGTEVSEWSGLSEPGKDRPVVQVVDHAVTANGDDDVFHRARQKAFMSSKPPREERTPVESRPAKLIDDDDPSEKLNLKHDLDLQRLLKESHLLEKSKASNTPGKERQMALDMRLQALGAKQSILKQEKMPAAHRKGIVQKAGLREARRRKEAQENGVILEKASPKSSKNMRRPRSVDIPSVGKFSGGTLKLSQRDIASIQGPLAAAKRDGRRK